MSSLAQLCLDGYFRTRKGFAVLIEQEWLSFGHRFAERTGQADSRHTHTQRAPVFLQWYEGLLR